MRTGERTSLKERDAAYDAPGEDAPYAAPLREWPRWERVVRVVAAVLVTLCLALYAYDWLRRPRVVAARLPERAYEQLLGDAAEGRVVRVDDREDFVRWQNRDGAVYQANHGGIDFRAAVERQPYVRDHPGSVTYARIDRPEPGGAVEVLGWFFLVFLLGTLARRPEPRRATRWGWVWIIVSVVGAPLYLLLSGSWSRSEPAVPPEGSHPWRAGGVMAFVLLGLVRSAGYDVASDLYEDGHPLRPFRTYVVPAEMEAFPPGRGTVAPSGQG